MELNELKQAWQAHEAKLEKSMKLNLHCVEMIQAQKVRSRLAPLFWQRVIELLFHITAIALLTAFLVAHIDEWRYALSALALLVFYILTGVNCIKQILIIKRMDYSDDVATIQRSLLKLSTHIVEFGRIAVLCIPTFLAYPMVVSQAIADLHLTGLSFMDIRSGYHGDWWQVQLIATLALIPLCTWLYSQVSYRNIDKKWVNAIIRRVTSPRVAKLLSDMKELEAMR